jgi:hypothetical protein
VAGVKTVRRFNDLIGLGYESYPTLLALATLAWHERRGLRRSATSILREVLPGPDRFKNKTAKEAVSSLDARGYLEFECQSPIWRPGGWRRCPRAWRLTVRGREKLQGLLQNMGLTLNDILAQPSPLDVKTLLDGRVRELYAGHWARVRRYEEAAGEAGSRHNT